MSDELPKLKTCNKCGNVLPRDAAHFMPYKGRSVDGLRAVCRECERAYDREQKRKRYAMTKKLKAG